MFIRHGSGWRFVGPLREADKDQGGETATLAERAQAIRAKAGDDPAAAASHLALMVAERERENAGYRQQLKDTRGKLPGEGAVVLDAAAAALWQSYQGLGTPEELTQRLTERETLATENAGYKREKTIAQVAKVAGYKADVLLEVGGALEYLTETVEESGKQVERAFVKQGDQKIAIDTHFAKLLPALKEQAERPGAGLGTPARQPAQTPAPSSTPAAPPRKPMTRL
jgi:hypothetical protein